VTEPLPLFDIDLASHCFAKKIDQGTTTECRDFPFFFC